MKKKYFLKSQSSLQRKIVAGGLTAAFVFGTVGSGFAGAMKDGEEIIISADNNNKLECKLTNITLEEITTDSFNKNSQEDLSFVQDIDQYYCEELKEMIFADDVRDWFKNEYSVSNKEKFDETWEKFQDKNVVVFNFLIEIKKSPDLSEMSFIKWHGHLRVC